MNESYIDSRISALKKKIIEVESKLENNRLFIGDIDKLTKKLGLLNKKINILYKDDRFLSKEYFDKSKKNTPIEKGKVNESEKGYLAIALSKFKLLFSGKK